MTDERIRRWLPTWIPESLLLAEESRAREVREAAAEAKARVADKAMDAVAQDAVGKDSYPDDISKLRKIRESIRISPQVSADVVLSKMGFPSPGERGRAFSGKSVLDVGGWFSGLAHIASGYWAKVTVADPAFFDSDVGACFEKDFRTIGTLVQDLRDRIAANGNETQKVRIAMGKNLAELEKVYAEMSFWEKYDAKLFPSISRLAAFAENLAGLPDSSQDLVFATNVVGKPTLDVERFHSELLRVLSPGGHAYVLDYDDPSALSNSSALASLLRKTRQVASFSDGWHRIIIS